MTGGSFQTTRWSVVVAAGGESSPDASRALAELCERYWAPIYAFVRRSGHAPEDARDLTQGFFAVLLEKGYLRDADRERGRFRTFLLASVRHYMSKERERNRAKKRGGGRAPLSLDFVAGEKTYRMEPADDRTPERVFERRWALALLETVLTRLSDEQGERGRAERFEALSPLIGGGAPAPSHREVAERLGMTEGAVKAAVHRLRQRYRSILREEIAKTVSDPAAVDDEIRHLLEAVRLHA